ncbi:hypothetical protein BUALT_Bualt14G0052200 [Buddleja alternifolia]|uniref:SET domain-containing protein n=1 Tax=Buddleja alternifolia TaxID=168488 RepID=A0AAV6WMZ9_9LAMI|nr:hypothetical protein BUALT_Bualt14G0052200 [Buddleja alternifolia]
MAPNTKNRKACLAMKKLGYSEKIVRPVLKRLLALYENNWLLIEENDYLVLIEALFDSEKEKASVLNILNCLYQSNELEKMNHLSDDDVEENEPPLKRSKQNSQNNQFSRSSHSSSPNCSKQKMAESSYEKLQYKNIKLEGQNLSKQYHGKGKNSSSPLSPTGNEQTKEFELISDGESDDYNYPVPLACLENNGDEYDSVHAFSEKRIITYERGKHKVFSNERGDLHDDDLDLEANLPESEPMSYDLVEFGVPLAVIPPVSPRILCEGNSHENDSSAKENCSIFPEVIDLDADDTCTDPPLLLENTSDMDGNHLEYMDYGLSKAEKSENNAQDSMKLLDIASSSRGEVGISLIVKSSPRSDFHVPSLEEVLKQVEEQCLKSYGIIPQNGFSLLRLMKDMCECFLVKSTTSNHIDDVGPTNVVSSLAISNDLDSQTVPSELTDHQISLCSISTVSNGPIRFQNLFKVSNQISRSIRSMHLDLSRCKIYLNVDVNGSNEMDKNALELNNGASSSRTMIVQNQHYHQYIEDITKGHEAYEISLINESNNDPLPKFSYILKNVNYQSAYTRFLLSRISEEDCCSKCFMDCLSAEIPCACAGKTGGEFAYTQCGLLKEKFVDDCISMKRSGQQQNLLYCQDCPLEKPNDKSLSGKCKGHLVRKFIKECWYKCGCSLKCGNRVVQRGITVKLQVFMTPDMKGWGLRTLEEIPKGALICEYVGEVVTVKELSERNRQHTGDNHTYPVLLDAGWSREGVVKDEKALCIVATRYGNVARFINHRCSDANLVDIPVEVESPDHHYYHLAFFTTRKVNAMEELTWDYGIDFNNHHLVKAFQCQCGSEFCRDRKSTKS